MSCVFYKRKRPQDFSMEALAFIIYSDFDSTAKPIGLKLIVP